MTMNVWCPSARLFFQMFPYIKQKLEAFSSLRESDIFIFRPLEQQRNHETMSLDKKYIFIIYVSETLHTL